MDELLAALGRADRLAVRERGRAGGAGGVRRDRAGGGGLHRARGRPAVRAAAAFGRRRADAARARVQVRALRGAGGRAGGVHRRHRRGARSADPRRSCIPRTSTTPRSGSTTLAPLARSAGVPIVVDAAFQSFPLSTLARWSRAGDVACFSAKYFWGPNGGGFVAGRAGLVADIAALDFVGYESGRWRTFGRAFKLDRATVAATVAALDGVGRARPRRAARGLCRRGAVARCAVALRRVALKQFTLDERLVDGPVNAVVAARRRLRWPAPTGGGRPERPRDRRRRRARALHRGADGGRGRGDRRSAWERLDDG